MKQSLSELFGLLDAWKEPIPIDYLEGQLQRTAIDCEDVARAIAFGSRSYQRNLLHEGPAYHALVLCWRPGQRSPIHDHTGSSCGVCIVKGVATETLFERTAEGLVYAVSSRQLREGGILGSFDDSIHQISNLQGAGQDLISLHIYSPPLIKMNLFSLTDARIETFVDPIEYFSDGAGI